MTPLAFLAIILALWTVAAVLWLLDAPSPRQTADVVLSARDMREQEPVTTAPALYAA
ncbi:hypothetical protein ACTQ49_04945 [Luteococcus sp. Sow4_B9]|uniref:hypothetical protein n=1 Tax=Luteococcus sp. Sow4_B9 TaxID=3438792 RepID=UPI003F990FDC